MESVKVPLLLGKLTVDVNVVLPSVVDTENEVSAVTIEGDVKAGNGPDAPKVSEMAEVKLVEEGALPFKKLVKTD